MARIQTCSFEGCDASVRLKPAPAIPTQVSVSSGTRTVFDVKFCDEGHVIDYIGRQMPLAEGYA